MAAFGFLCLVTLLLASSAAACNRCVRQSKVAFFSRAQALQSGACGYGSLAIGFNNGRIAAAAPSIYKDGAGCGACFQMRCDNEKICSKEGATVIVTDQNHDNTTDFVVSSRAFAAMAKNGIGPEVLKLGIANVQYRRVPCDYKNKNLVVRVVRIEREATLFGDETTISRRPNRNSRCRRRRGGSANWNFMSRNYGAVWDTSRVPEGALQLQFVVTSGYNGKWYWAKSVLPADWINGAIYDSGIQITDIAAESCAICDDSSWKQ